MLGNNYRSENAENSLRNVKQAVSGAARRPFQDVANVQVDAQFGTRVAGKSNLNALKPAAPLNNNTNNVSYSELLDRRAETASMLNNRRHSELPDIDSSDRNNPLSVSDYVNDIMAWHRRVEPGYMPPADYMRAQGDINEKMRAILIDWLVEVHLKFKLMPETLYLTVSCIDRFLAKKTVTRKNLQLVGVTAMLIASKYEEIWAPEVRDFVYISDKAYTRDQILQMEKVMLNTLGFHLTVPTPHMFLARFNKAAKSDKDTQLLAQYLVELALVDYQMLKYPGSMVAAAAVYVASRCRLQSALEAWPPALEKHARYSLAEMTDCISDLTKLQKKAPSASLQAVYKKFSNAKFQEVAKIEPEEDLIIA